MAEGAAVGAHMGGHGRGRGHVEVVVVSGSLYYYYCCCCCCFPNIDRGRGHGHGRSSHICRRRWAAAVGTNDSVRHSACSCLLQVEAVAVEAVNGACLDGGRPPKDG